MNIKHTDEIDHLFESFLTLSSVDECRAYFDDLCTIKEIQDFSQRLAVAIKLNEGTSYNEISEKTGGSSATISRVAKCLSNGSGGYTTVIDRLCKDK